MTSLIASLLFDNTVNIFIHMLTVYHICREIARVSVIFLVKKITTSTVTITDHGECLSGNLDRLINISITQRGVDKVVVMIGKEDAALDALGDPFLMELETGIIGNTKVREHLSHADRSRISRPHRASRFSSEFPFPATAAAGSSLSFC